MIENKKNYFLKYFKVNIWILEVIILWNAIFFSNHGFFIIELIEKFIQLFESLNLTFANCTYTSSHEFISRNLLQYHILYVSALNLNSSIALIGYCTIHMRQNYIANKTSDFKALKTSKAIKQE